MENLCIRRELLGDTLDRKCGRQDLAEQTLTHIAIVTEALQDSRAGMAPQNVLERGKKAWFSSFMGQSLDLDCPPSQEKAWPWTRQSPISKARCQWTWHWERPAVDSPNSWEKGAWSRCCSIHYSCLASDFAALAYLPELPFTCMKLKGEKNYFLNTEKILWS